MITGMARATKLASSSSESLSPSGSETGGIIIWIACCLRARQRVSTHIAGTTHMAGAAGPGGATGPDDDDAEDDEAAPIGGAAGEDEDELEEAAPVGEAAGGDEAEFEEAPHIRDAWGQACSHARASRVNARGHTGFPLRG